MRILSLLVALFLALGAAKADEFRVVDIRAYLYLSKTGTVSENLVGTKNFLFNVVAGSEFGGPASNVLIDLTLANNDQVRPRQFATLRISYKSKGDAAAVTRSYPNNLIAPGETVHESLMLEDATCYPMAIEARIGAGPVRKATIPFNCGE